MRTVPVHYLRPNETVWTPPAVACFDTETSWRMTGAGEVHRLACWAARMEVRRGRRGQRGGVSDDDGTAPSDLALVMDVWARRNRSLWAYAHNLAFDLTTTGLPGQLRDLGWTVTDFAVDSPAPFVRLARGGAHLTLADSFSWLPVSLDRVAGALGMTKLPLPAPADDLGTWLERCRTDV